MALQTVKGWLELPSRPTGAAAFGLNDDTLLDADLEGIGAIVRVPKAGDIRKIRFSQKGMTTAGDLDIRIETVGATDGLPTGTLWGTDTRQTQAMVTGDANTEKVVTLIANATVARGDLIAIVVQRPTGSTYVGRPLRSVDGYRNAGGQDPLAFPYALSKTGASWSKTVITPYLTPEYSDGTYEVFDTAPVIASTAESWQNGTNPNHRGLRFKVPFKGRLHGCILKDTGNNTDVTVKLYSPTALLTSVTIDKDQMGGTTRWYYLWFTTAQTIEANTYYRLVLFPTTAGLNTTTLEFRVTAAVVLDAFPGGQDFHWTQANNPADPVVEGDWTQTLTKRPAFTLLFDQLSDDAGAAAAPFQHQQAHQLVIA